MRSNRLSPVEANAKNPSAPLEPAKTAVFAGSKGAEGFLAFASTGDKRLLLIDKVMLRSAGTYAFEGTFNINTKKSKNTGHSAWTYGGIEVPFIFYKGKVKVESFRPFKINIAHLYENSIAKAKKKGRASIALLTLDHLPHAEVLFLSGEKDKLWPSVAMINDLLEHHIGARNFSLCALEDAGHFLFAEHKDKKFKSAILFGDTTQEASEKAQKIAFDFLSN